MEEKVIDFNNSDNGNLLIVGNGFDLDLGYPTSYKDFFENNNERNQGGFPFVRGGHDYHALGRFILKQAQINKWYDLEDILAQFGSRIVFSDGEDPKTDKLDYNMLVNSLALYLKSIDYSHPNNSSVAARLLGGLSRCLISPTVYSFNYTDVSSICEAVGTTIGNVNYVHGNLAENSIILGVGDYGQLTARYDFMYKTSNPQYKSTNLFHELDSCNNLLIFGLSMSQVDYPYFEDFSRRWHRGHTTMTGGNAFGYSPKTTLRGWKYFATSAQ